ncbi:MAG: ABC transporter permease [Acidobacteriota bacterium]|nr:ABC transporter permease [Acidobacteriota bacterium]
MNIGPIFRAMKHNRTRVILLVLEIALTLAIVTNCINVIIAERAKINRPSGFDDDNLLWVRTRPFSPEFREDATVNVTADADVRALESIPGVRAAASTSFRLWEGGGSSTKVRPVTGGAPQSTQSYFGTKDIFATLGSRVVAGRAFREGDHGIGTQDDPLRVAVITKTLADALFPDGQAVGKTIVRTSDSGEANGDPVVVVGVIERFFNPYGMNADMWSGLADRAMFRPARVGSYSNGLRYLVRTEPGKMASVMKEAEKRLISVNPGRVVEFQPTPEKKARWFATSRLTVGVMSGVIVALVFVTALGILGITGLSVSERTKQIGTRRALGATRADILRYFLIENWLTTTAGLVLGTVGAYALNFLLVSHVTDVKLQWPLVAFGVLLLWINGLVATLPPALRATRLSPSIATRSV